METLALGRVMVLIARFWLSIYLSIHLSVSIICLYIPARMHAYMHTCIHAYMHTYLHAESRVYDLRGRSQPQRPSALPWRWPMSVAKPGISHFVWAFAYLQSRQAVNTLACQNNWVAVKELSVSCHSMGIWYKVGFSYTSNLS